MGFLPRFLSAGFEGFEVVDVKEWLNRGYVEIYLKRRAETALCCSRCGSVLTVERGRYRQRLETMSILGLRCFVIFNRSKGHCPNCRKARSEHVGFVSVETPHLTQDFAWWIGKLCEVAAVSRVAELVGHDETTTWRLDLKRMKRMLSHYKIPEVTAISVDEVYVRKKPKFEGESRDNRFFTVICDLKTRRVIWVSESRRKEALDQFFILIGKEACEKIAVVASDLHKGYAESIGEHCPRATHVYDRFHLMQIFEEAVNETRKSLHEELGSGDEAKRLSRGQFRYLFLKKAVRRTESERTHIDDVLKANARFARLEIIKERMLTFFDAPTEQAAKEIFEEIGDWIWQASFQSLMNWHRQFEKSWAVIKNYFQYRVTSSLSEGINNVIKMLKRRAFGYKNMEYFRLKIMQVCGYLNSRYIPTPDQLLAQI